MDEERKQKIIELKENGWSWQAIGVYFGISRARVHQIGSGYKTQLKIYERVKERDNYTCQWQLKCNGKNKQSDLIVHHMDFNDRNNDPENLITLCRACHSYFHNKKALRGELTKAEIGVIERKKEKEERMKKWTRKCNYCGKTFIVPKGSRFNYYRSHNKFNRPSYCSRKCFADYIAHKNT